MTKIRLIIAISVMAMLTNSAKATIVYDTLVKLGATWKYLDDGTDQGSTTWKSLTYSDASWASGPGPLGFGDPWIVTCIHSGCGSTITCTPTCTTITITDYFRKQINIPSTAIYDSVSMDAQIDDGIYMYVNGTLVWTYNMTPPSTYMSWSDITINGADETTLQHITIPISYFVSGNNQIAVELHQRGPTTSDATLDMRMRFKHKTSTGVNALSNENKFNVFPNPSNGSFTIESANTSYSENAKLMVYDLAGRLVADQDVQFADAKTNVNLSLVPGMYFVHIIDGVSNNTIKINVN